MASYGVSAPETQSTFPSTATEETCREMSEGTVRVEYSDVGCGNIGCEVIIPAETDRVEKQPESIPSISTKNDGIEEHPETVHSGNLSPISADTDNVDEESGSSTPSDSASHTVRVQHSQASLATNLTVHYVISIQRFIDDPKTIQFYTGFDNFRHFMFFFNILGE